MMIPFDLSLRDYIAIKAMQALMTLHPKELSELRGDDIDTTLSKMVSKVSYTVADEMLKERENAKT
jgi:hypothetical protein